MRPLILPVPPARCFASAPGDASFITTLVSKLAFNSAADELSSVDMSSLHANIESAETSEVTKTSDAPEASDAAETAEAAESVETAEMWLPAPQTEKYTAHASQMPDMAPEVTAGSRKARSRVHTEHAFHIEIAPVSRHLANARTAANDDRFLVHDRRLKGKSSLPSNATAGDLCNLVSDGNPAATVVIGCKQVMDLNQTLMNACGFTGSQCILVVKEIILGKLKGGMMDIESEDHPDERATAANDEAAGLVQQRALEVEVWDYLLGTELGRAALRVLLHFLSTPQTFQLQRVARRFRHHFPCSIIRLDLPTQAGPTLEWIVSAFVVRLLIEQSIPFMRSISGLKLPEHSSS